MRYSTMINGYTSLNLTKLDVLDGFKEIKVATKYKLDGKEVEGFPGESPRSVVVLIAPGSVLIIRLVPTLQPTSISSAR